MPLFAGLDPKTKGAIASALGQVSMPKGTAVVTQGERGHAFYIVESGQLSAFKDNSPLPVLSYGPGATRQTLGGAVDTRGLTRLQRPTGCVHSRWRGLVVGCLGRR